MHRPQRRGCATQRELHRQHPQPHRAGARRWNWVLGNVPRTWGSFVLAENVSLGRNFDGIHWRSDGVEGLKFGEAVAIQNLREMKLTSNETFQGYSLMTFEGKRVDPREAVSVKILTSFRMRGRSRSPSST